MGDREHRRPSLRGVIEHPELTLAGVYVTSAAKAGKDAGDLCGLPATGVTATNDIDEILALNADCVLYMPAACNVDEVCALLASGANVVTTRGEFHHPDSIDPAVRARVEAACRAGRHLHPLDRVQPRVHLRGAPDRARRRSSDGWTR